MSQKSGRPRGRPKGSKSKRTVEREQAMREVAEKIAGTLPDAFGGDAHALLISIYKDARQDMHLRVDAAKAALPYEKPKLASIEVQADVSVRRSAADMTDDELAALIAASSAGAA